MKKHVKQEARGANAIDATACEFEHCILCCVRKIMKNLVTRSNQCKRICFKHKMKLPEIGSSKRIQ